MTNTAKILNFGRGNFAEQELRVADIVTNGAIVIHTQRLKSDPGGNLLS